MPAPFGYLAILLILALGILITRALVRFSHEFELIVRNRQVQTPRQVPPDCRRPVISFFKNDVDPSFRARIIGRRDGARGIRLEISGRLSSWEKQRIRNFLMVTLARI